MTQVRFQLEKYCLVIKTLFINHYHYFQINIFMYLDFQNLIAKKSKLIYYNLPINIFKYKNGLMPLSNITIHIENSLICRINKLKFHYLLAILILLNLYVQ